MATEKRLIDMEDALRRMENAEHLMHSINGIKAVDIGAFRQFFGMLKPVDAVEVEKYEALVEMYHELRENFIDYVCSGVPNPAPYCLNKCEGCVDRHGWCKNDSDKCQGFNPAEVVLDEERKPKSGTKCTPVEVESIDFDYEAED